MKALFYPEHDFKTLMIPWIYKEIYLDRCYDVLNDTKDLTILDIGANIGLVTEVMRPHARVVHSVEPTPDAFEALKMNAEYNGWDNVTLHNLAIADVDGEMELTIPDHNKTMGSLVVGKRATKGSAGIPLLGDLTGLETYEVMGGKYIQPIGKLTRLMTKVRRLDTFLSENNIESVDFMKLDVEGAEEMILRGEGFLNVKDKIRCILMEFHYPNWMDLALHLVGLGYKSHQLKTDGNVLVFNR